MKKRVLVVDDIYANRFIIEEVLSEYDVYSVPDGAGMREYLKTVIPDIILMDVNLPEQDGFEIAKDLKSNPQTKDIPIVFLTVHNTKSAVMHSIKAGGSDFITKPFDETDLKNRVDKVLRDKLKKI